MEAVQSHPRFFNFVSPEPNSGCWLWDGPGGQYGALGKQQAHRISYRIHQGAIPPGGWVLHSCDTPGCVNPDHLRVGSPKDNSTDMVARGRVGRKRPVKERFAHHGLMTHGELRQARHSLGWTQRELAAALDMNMQTIVNMEAGHPSQPIKLVTALAVECLLRRAGKFDEQSPALGPQIVS